MFVYDRVVQARRWYISILPSIGRSYVIGIIDQILQFTKYNKLTAKYVLWTTPFGHLSDTFRTFKNYLYSYNIYYLWITSIFWQFISTLIVSFINGVY